MYVVIINEYLKQLEYYELRADTLDLWYRVTLDVVYNGEDKYAFIAVF